MENQPELQRTLKQNKALHLYFRLVAEALNDAGLDMRKVLKPAVEIQWNASTVKEYLWRPVQKYQLLKQSTTELTTKEIDSVVSTLNMHLAKFGVEQEFPSIQAIIDRVGREFIERQKL